MAFANQRIAFPMTDLRSSVVAARNARSFFFMSE